MILEEGILVNLIYHSTGLITNKADISINRSVHHCTDEDQRIKMLALFRRIGINQYFGKLGLLIFLLLTRIDQIHAFKYCTCSI